MAARSTIDENVSALGYLPDAYGRHVIRGITVSDEVNPVGDDKQVNAKVLLGRSGTAGWDGIELVMYDGVVIDGAHYTFFDGTIPPSEDTRFPHQIKHGGVSRLSLSLPTGIADDNDPSKLASVVRCKKVHQYDIDGNEAAAVFSTNPADQFLDAIREDSLRNGLDFSERIIWEDYLTAWFWFDGELTYPDYSKIPKNLRVARTSGGSLAAGHTYAISAQGISGANYSQRTGEATITVSGSNRSITVSGEPTDGVADYRLWIRDLADPDTFYYHDVTSAPNYTFTALPSETGEPGVATGDFMLTRPRMESHAAFTTPTDLPTVLNAICLQAGCDWQKVGRKYRILLPHNREVQHTFDESNTMPGTFRYWYTDVDERINRIVCNFREATDPYLRPAPELIVNRTELQEKHGLRIEPIQLWGMSRHQAMRVMSLRMKQLYDRALHCEFEDDGSGAHLLPGDVVEVFDGGAGFFYKQFVILEIEPSDSDDGDRRKFTCREWSNTDYQDSDGDNLPTTSVVPVPVASRFSAPPAVANINLTTGYVVVGDGTTNGYINVGVTFGVFVNRQFGRLYHKRPGDSDYTMIATLYPEGGTNFAGHRVELAKEGTHYFKVQTVSAIGVEQTDPVVEYDVAMPLYLVAPPRSTSFSGEQRDSLIRWSWIKVPARNVSGYRITDGSNMPIRDVGNTDFWYEPLPPTTTVTRRLYTIDTSGNVSTDYREATFETPYTQPQVVFSAPVASSNFAPGGFDSDGTGEDGEMLNYTGGTLNPDSRAFTKTASDGYNAGFSLSRAVAYGDATFRFDIPFPYNGTEGVIFAWNYGTSVAAPTGLSGISFGMQLETSTYSGTGASRIKIIEGGSIVATLAVPWAQNDRVWIKVEGSAVKYYLNDESNLIYTSATGNAKYPLVPKVLIYKNGQTLAENTFVLTGLHTEADQLKAHWRNCLGARPNSSDNLTRTAASSGWGTSGAFSVESFYNAGYIEFDYSSSNVVAVGVSRADADQNYTSMEFGVITSATGFTVVENGSTVGSEIGASNGDRIRIVMMNGDVRYYKNGVLAYDSVSTVPTGARWYADCAINTSAGVISNLRFGNIGSKGRGWSFNPNGLAEIGGGVKIAGANVQSVRERSIGAVTPGHRYRGNDIGTPVVERLTASHFRLGNCRTVVNDVQSELWVDVSESILDDGYSNFDSVRLVRVKVYNIFGETVGEQEQPFGGRGKVLLGLHTRDHADPVEQAVFGIQFKNAYGWSREVYWTNASASGDLWGASNYNFTGNGTTTPPTWRQKASFHTALMARAASHKLLVLNWQPQTTNPFGFTTKIKIRPFQRGNTRAAWRDAMTGLGNTETTKSFSQDSSSVPLSPNTEYEVMIAGPSDNMWSNIAYVKTNTAPITTNASREAPMGLSFRLFRNIFGPGVNLNWERMATDNNNVEIYKDGTLVSTDSGGTTSYVASLTAGQTYRFAVRNKWSSGTTYSDFSNEVEVVVPADIIANDDKGVSNLKASLTATGNGVILTWDKNNGNSAEVQRSTDAGASWTQLTANAGSGVVTYTDSGVGYDTHVSYRVRNTSGGNSEWSNVVDIWTAPDMSSPDVDLL